MKKNKLLDAIKKKYNLIHGEDPIVITDKIINASSDFRESLVMMVVHRWDSLEDFENDLDFAKLLESFSKRFEKDDDFTLSIVVLEILLDEQSLDMLRNLLKNKVSDIKSESDEITIDTVMRVEVVERYKRWNNKEEKVRDFFFDEMRVEDAFIAFLKKYKTAARKLNDTTHHFKDDAISKLFYAWADGDKLQLYIGNTF